MNYTSKSIVQNRTCFLNLNLNFRLILFKPHIHLT